MPIDRMRMRPWLQKQIESSQIPGLKWLNKEEQIFQIPWIHASHQMWDLEKDAPLFMRWAIHTAKYRPGVDSPNPKTWKSNFRCALNSLSDIVEVKDKTNRKGSNAFRVFKMLSVERSTERGIKKLTKKIVKDSQIQSRSERCIPEAGPGGDAKTDASRVKQEPTEVDVNDFEIKEEPDDFPIEDIVRVRIGENGDVEETDEPVFRVNPQTRAQRESSSDTDSVENQDKDFPESTVHHILIKTNKQMKLVRRPHRFKLDHGTRTRTGAAPLWFQDGGEGSGLMLSKS